MHIGQYISGGAHAVLISWVLLGGVFRSSPEPVEVTGVDIITTEQFEALLANDVAPSPETNVEAPVAPEITPDPVPEPPQITPPDPVTPPEPPTPTEPPVADPVPEVIPEPQPPAPVIAPEPEEITPPAPEPEVSAPVQSPRPVARPVNRVAPEAVAAPEPDVQIADVDQAPTEQADEAEQVEEAQEATAREEAATEIPTEPQQQAAAPVTSVRPKARPSRPAQSAQTQTETPAEPAQTNSSSVEDALAQALADTPAAPSGPPLTQGEKDALRISVQECWVVDVGSQAANVTVTVAMSLDREGKVQSGSLRMLSAEGGNENAARAAFDAARRAILRCQRGGYNLPIEKYDHWRDVEMTFNPENMRRR